MLDGALFESHTGSGALLDFCLMDTGVNSCESSDVGVNHSPLLGVEIKNDCSHYFTPHVCLRGVDGCSFGFSGRDKEN